MADPEPVNAPWKKDDKLVSQGRGVWTAIVVADVVGDGHMPIRGTRPDGSTFLDWAHPDDWELAPPPARTVRDVIPATDEEVEKWRITAEIQNPALDSARVLAMIARIDAEKARADQAEAERDALADWVLGADHHPGCSGTFPGHRCKCHRDDLEAILDAYVDRVTGGVEADG